MGWCIQEQANQEMRTGGCRCHVTGNEGQCWFNGEQRDLEHFSDKKKMGQKVQKYVLRIDDQTVCLT